VADFEVGVPDLKTLQYRIEKADSKLQLGTEHSNKIAVIRDIRSTNVLDWKKWAQQENTINQPFLVHLFHYAVENYFYELSHHLQLEFRIDFARAESLYLSLGGSNFSSLFEDQPSFLNSFLSVFIKPGQNWRGMVVATGFFPMIKMSSEILGENIRLEHFPTELALSVLGSQTELDRRIIDAAGFLSKSRTEYHKGRYTDSLMYEVIACETLFSEKINTAEKVCKRIAVLTWADSGRSYNDHFRTVKECYDARSRYVHDGNKIGSELAETFTKIVCNLYKAIIRFRRTINPTENSFEDWLKQLDYVAGAHEAGVRVDNKVLAQLGIDVPNESFSKAA
jgi:hypothetical protein